ncbi:MAG: TrkA family potassium uptake protein [Clostridiaceae bacterium]|nr:TrkA family potassium uptake protein [Clostridiaceae bacterium]
MKKIKDVAVIGCGRFGYQVAMTLTQVGVDVIAIDEQEEIINKLSNDVTYAVCADVTQENVLAEIGIGNCDAAVIGIGDRSEAAIMATLACKELGIPMIIAKAKNESVAKVLRKIGATQVVIPERDQATKLALSLVSNKMSEIIELSSSHSVMDVTCPASWVGKSLKELEIRPKYGVTIIGIIRKGQPMISPHADDVLEERDHLFALGDNKALTRLSKEMRE